MNDMASVIVPKSDQFNADDLLAGSRTFTIREVQIRGGQDQPVSIYFEGHEKAYRPCKSMSRCLVYAWGPDASKYKDRSLTLYCDPTVKWGGMEVGGIRISHMSHLDGPLTMALTATRGSRKPFKVLPLVRQADHDLERLRMAADEAASNGTKAYEAFWKAASKEDRLKLADGHDNRKSAAAAADAQAKEIAQQAAMGDDDFPGDTQPPQSPATGESPERGQGIRGQRERRLDYD
jgi:hypothetical protein